MYDQCSHHIETSSPNLRANPVTTSYMIVALVINRFINALKTTGKSAG